MDMSAADLEEAFSGNSTGANGSSGNLTTAHRDLFLANIEVTLLASMFTVAVIGNSLALIALALRSRKLSRMHYFILHLCVSDLVVAFFHILPQVLLDVTGQFLGGYAGDNALCKIVKYLQLLGPCLSSYVLVVTAIDRYQAICFPLMNCSWTPKRSKVMIGAAWAVSLLLSVPQAFIFSYTLAIPYDHMDCWASFAPPWAEKAYILWNVIAVFVVPLLVLIFTYTCICRVIWINFQFKIPAAKAAKGSPPDVPSAAGAVADGAAKALHLNNSSVVVGGAYRFKGKGKVEVTLYTDGVNGGSLSGQNGHSKEPLHPRAHSVSGISRAKMKTIKLTVVVILCYVACSLPYFSSVLYVTWYPGAQNSSFIRGYAYVILALLASLNSCVNPWLYLAFNENLAKTLQDLFCCRLRHVKRHGFGGATYSRSSVSETRSCTAAPAYRTHNNVIHKANDKIKLTNATNKNDVPNSTQNGNHWPNDNHVDAVTRAISAEPATEMEPGRRDGVTPCAAAATGPSNLSPTEEAENIKYENDFKNDVPPKVLKIKIKNAIGPASRPRNRTWKKIPKQCCGSCKDSCNCDAV